MNNVEVISVLNTTRPLPGEPGPSIFGPATRRLIRAAARLANPLIARLAGRRWMPIVGIVHHQGRRSGRGFATPVGMRRFGDGIVIPLTFGPASHWYQNIRAAGGGRATYLGSTQALTRPEVLDWAAASKAFPGYERVLFRGIGIYQFLWLHAA